MSENEEYQASAAIKLLRVLLIQLIGVLAAVAAFKLSDAILIVGAKLALVIASAFLLIWGYLLLRKYKKDMNARGD